MAQVLDHMGRKPAACWASSRAHGLARYKVDGWVWRPGRDVCSCRIARASACKACGHRKAPRCHSPNANLPAQVRQVALEAIERARRGDGPTLIECETYRYR